MTDMLHMVTINNHCREASEHASVAYWLNSVGEKPDYHVKTVIEEIRKAADVLGFDLVERANAALAAAAPDLLALAIKQESEIKRLKAALAVATDYFSDRADHADDTGSNDEMRALSEITGIMEGYYAHA